MAWYLSLVIGCKYVCIDCDKSDEVEIVTGVLGSGLDFVKCVV